MKKPHRSRSQAVRQKVGDEMSNDLLSMLLAQEVDFAADYARRGRGHRNLTEGELAEAWKAAYRACSYEPESTLLRSAERDLQAELDLRGIVLPFDVDDLNRLTIAAAQRLATSERFKDLG